jgi:Cyclic nucleotide-binding domain./PilZ domain.
LNNQVERQSHIINRFLDGSITIDSIGEFEKMLDIFPKNPAFHKAFADLLAREKSFDAAVDEYGEAAGLFINVGMTLQAIASKISEWQIVKPSYHEGLAFHSALREGISEDIPIRNFFAKMSYSEITAVIDGLVQVRLPAGKRVKKFYDAENDINFIVSGALNKRTYHHSEKEKEVRKISNTDLIENDFFGDIYPFEEEKRSRSDIETVTRVELVKISKPRLTKICREYPNVELLLEEMYKAQSELEKESSSHMVRKTVRYEVPTKIKIRSFTDRDGNKNPLVIEGITRNMSLGGACIVMGARYLTGPSANMVGRNVNIQISVPEAEEALNVLGTIVWSKEVSDEERTTVVVGVEFKDMTVLDRERLKKYCYGSNEADNLIFNLWESLMKA